MKTVIEVRNGTDVDVTPKPIQKMLRKRPHTTLMKPLNDPYFVFASTSQENMYEWAEAQIERYISEFKTGVFGDEKNFQLDVLDELGAYIFDQQRAPKMFSTKQHVENSLIIWGAITYNRAFTLVGFESKLEVQYHRDVTQQGLSDDANGKLGNVWIFVQFNKSSHFANCLLHFSETSKVRKLSWPAKSPDLNLSKTFGECSLIWCLRLADNSIAWKNLGMLFTISGYVLTVDIFESYTNTFHDV